MFGHEWLKATGTIVEMKAAHAGSGSTGVFDFVVDVRAPGLEEFRTAVPMPHLAGDFRLPHVGAEVGVEVEAGSRKVRFDKSDPRLSVKERKREEAAAFEESLHRPPGDAATTPARDGAAQVRQSTEDGLAELRRKLGGIGDQDGEAQRS